MLRAILVVWMVGSAAVAEAQSFSDARSGFPVGVPPIVNGELETGWPSVGALTLELPGYGYRGAFCSGTLIRRDWVLTAAHCVYPTEEFEPEPWSTFFYLGNDAQPGAAFSRPVEGRLVEVDRFFVHPQYDPYWTDNDIALVHLTRPVEDVTPTSASVTSFSDAMLGAQVLYVGFGVTDGDTREGGSVKRSTHVKLISYDSDRYMSMGAGQGVCFGDSGGPGLWEINGEWRVVGVNSTGWGTRENSCGGGSVHTRVDHFVGWIYEVMEEQRPDCREEGRLCLCDRACSQDGYCYNEVCSTWSCRRLSDCLSTCATGDMECRHFCQIRATESAMAAWEAMDDCFRTECSGVPFEDVESCRLQACGDVMAACEPMTQGDGTCRQVLEEAMTCPDAQEECVLRSMESGDEGAQATFDALVACLDEACGVSLPTSWNDACAWDRCAAAMETCAPEADCDPVDAAACSEGSACVLNPMGRFDCIPSLGAELGDPCAKDSLAPPCRQGLGCSDLGGDAHCEAYCYRDEDCEEGRVCSKPAMEGLELVGFCLCIDDDGDGVCSLLDCDDTDGNQAPGLPEVCGNEVDDNCDGELDEGCTIQEEPTPGDEGGSCHTSRSAPSSGLWTVLGLFLVLLSMSVLRRRSHQLR